MNFLFIQKVKEERKGIPLWAALKSDSVSMTTQMLHRAGAALIFGKTLDVALWDRRLNGAQVQLQRWRCDSDPVAPEKSPLPPGSGAIAAALQRGDALSPVDDATRFKKGDTILCFVFDPEAAAFEARLSDQGWQCIERLASDRFSTSVCHLPRPPRSGG